MQIKKKARAIQEMPACSMADIAFLLIIFFLVTTTMGMEKGLGLTLPSPGRQKKVPEENICNIWINAVGEVMLAGEPIEIPQIEQEIRERLAKNNKLIISVKTDRRTEYEVFIQVLDRLKLAGARKISLASPG